MKERWRAATLVVVLAFVVAGCGIQAPKASVSLSDDRILEVDGPSIRGSITTPDGVQVGGGAIWINPAAAIAEGIRLVSAGVAKLLGQVSGARSPATAAEPAAPPGPQSRCRHDANMLAFLAPPEVA